MKIHHCPVEDASVSFEGTCNWCGEKEWVGLTDDEIAEVANSCVWSKTYHVDFGYAVEAKLKEKNT